MKHVFIAIDMQKDFMDKGGALYVQGSEEIKPVVKSLIEKIDNKYLIRDDVELLYTIDYHTDSDDEISNNPDFISTFPKHCMKDTEGSKLIPEAISQKYPEEFADNKFYKNTFSVFKSNKSFLQWFYQVKDVGSIYVFGVAGDICVKGVIDGLIKNKDSGFDFSNLFVVVDAIASINQREFEEYLANLLSKYEFMNIILSHQI